MDGLAAALLASSNAPVLLIDGKLKLIVASASFCSAFAVGPIGPRGCWLRELGDGEWDTPQLRVLLGDTIAGHIHIPACEMDLERPGLPDRKLVLKAQRLQHGGGVGVLLSVSDVTDARLSEKLRDDLLRERGVMLQEMQHRVANSLQIIAGVLLQSASRVQSDETRRHLHDAHNRVMSVAALQRQLSTQRLADVPVRAYLSDLCRSIAASMVRDHDQLSLDVQADDAEAPSDVSMALGLIVTELVINALKHAFPLGKRGKIVVGYRRQGPGWTLSVRDNGVGLPKDADQINRGLGAGIVDALAGQVDARVETKRLRPGLMILVICQPAPSPVATAVQDAAASLE